MTNDTMNRDDDEVLLCSNCFEDQGLKLDAQRLGKEATSYCPNCGSADGAKLTAELIKSLAYRFFVRGTMIRTEYGGAPHLQFNFEHRTDIRPPRWLENDLRLLERAIHAGIFWYGPRLWMVGEIEPLKDLQDASKRPSVIQRILSEYPSQALSKSQLFYRLRKAPSKPDDFNEYDSPPSGTLHSGRIDLNSLNVMYASPDLETCIHECRVTSDDDLYIATLAANKPLKLLDLTSHLTEAYNVTEFESLDLSLNMLFLAGARLVRDSPAASRECFGSWV